MKIKTGDKVRVIKGKDRGKSGVVVAADHDAGRVKVEGINIYKRHRQRGGRDRTPGGIVEIVAPMDIAKVKLICPSCSTPTRVGYKLISDKKERICRKCNAVIKDAKR